MSERPGRTTNRVAGRRGSVLVPVVAAMLILVLSGFTLTEMFGSQRMQGVLALDAARAFWVAEAGVQLAAHQSAEVASEVDFAGGTLTVAKSGSRYTATGAWGGARRVVSQDLEAVPDSTPELVGVTVTSSRTATTDHTVAIPAHAAGHVLVLAFTQTRKGSSPATATVTPPGWTVVRDVEAGDKSAVRLTVLVKVGDGVEASLAVATTLATGFGAICAAYSGVTGAVDVSAEASQESGKDMTAPSVATGAPNTRVVWCYAFDDDKSKATNVATGAGFRGTLRGYAEHNGPDNGFACALSDAWQAAAGATGSCVFRTNKDSDAGCAVTLALTGS